MCFTICVNLDPVIKPQTMQWVNDLPIALPILSTSWQQTDTIIYPEKISFIFHSLHFLCRSKEHCTQPKTNKIKYGLHSPNFIQKCLHTKICRKSLAFISSLQKSTRERCAINHWSVQSFFKFTPCQKTVPQGYTNIFLWIWILKDFVILKKLLWHDLHEILGLFRRPKIQIPKNTLVH